MVLSLLGSLSFILSIQIYFKTWLLFLIPPLFFLSPAQYFVTTMIIVGLSVIATVIVLQYHHHDPYGDKMPKWVGIISSSPLSMSLLKPLLASSVTWVLILLPDILWQAYQLLVKFLLLPVFQIAVCVHHMFRTGRDGSGSLFSLNVLKSPSHIMTI